MLGDRGTMSCPFHLGFLLIEDENECRASAKSWGKPFHSTGCYKTKRPGCFDTGDDTYFSTCYNNERSSRYASVCKGKYIAFIYLW